MHRVLRTDRVLWAGPEESLSSNIILINRHLSSTELLMLLLMIILLLLFIVILSLTELNANHLQDRIAMYLHATHNHSWQLCQP